jgi:surface antigen
MSFSYHKWLPYKSWLIVGYAFVSYIKFLFSVLILIAFGYGMIFPQQFQQRVYRPTISANFISNDEKYPENWYITLDNIQFNTEAPDKFVYIVKPGDSLPKIAQDFGTTVSNIMSINKLSTRTLKIWQALTITKLEGMIYVIDQNLTVAQFAHQYSLDLEELVSMNYYPDENQVLWTGDEIFIAISEQEAMENWLIEKPQPVLPNTSKSTPKTTPKKQYYVIKKTDNLTYVPATKTNKSWTKAVGWAWKFNTAGKNFWFANGQCTAYVAAVRKDIWKPWTASPFRGNAKQRYNNAAEAGLSVGKKPAKGAIVVLTNGDWVNPYYGHVGIVKAVNDDGTITVESMNWRWGRWVVTVDKYDTTQAKWYIYGK